MLLRWGKLDVCWGQVEGEAATNWHQSAEGYARRADFFDFVADAGDVMFQGIDIHFCIAGGAPIGTSFCASRVDGGAMGAPKFRPVFIVGKRGFTSEHPLAEEEHERMLSRTQRDRKTIDGAAGGGLGEGKHRGL